jgi:hypothetical protein
VPERDEEELLLDELAMVFARVALEHLIEEAAAPHAGRPPKIVTLPFKDPPR